MTCDKCHESITTAFRVGSMRYCEPCYGPRTSVPLNLGLTKLQSSFEPHYEPILKKWVYSWKEKRELLEKCKSKEHPDGFHLLNEYPEKIAEYKKIRANREELIAESYKKAGFNYVPGSNVNFDDKRKEFVPRHAPNPWKRKYF